MMGQGDSQYFYLDVPIHAITISTKISMSGCDEDVGHPGERRGNMMMMTIMKKMLSIPGER